MFFYDIKPYIRYAEKIKKVPVQNMPLASYDHIMIYVSGGSGIISLDNQPYELKSGCGVIIKPGTFYVLKESAKLTYIQIHFDYTPASSSDKSCYIQPDNETNFNETRILNVVFKDEMIFNSNVFIDNISNKEEYIRLILSEFGRMNKHFVFCAGLSLSIVLLEIARKMTFENDRISKEEDSTDNIIEYIHENYNKNIKLSDVAKKYGYHSAYVGQIVKNKTGYPMHKYIMLRRITKSIELLQCTDMKIYEIAEAVGFNDESHFSKTFKQMMGKNANEFRNKGQ